MQTKYLLLAINFLIPLCVAGSQTNTIKSKNKPSSTKNYMKSLYENINGFSIPQEERDLVNKTSSATYGEIKYKSLKTILDDLKPTKKDIFYDLGSGVGKVAIQACLDYPFKKSVGIELSKTRLEHSQKIRAQIKKDKKIEKSHNLFFHYQDITQANLSDASFIFTCSTCFPKNLMQTLTNKFAALKSGTKILTLKHLETHPKIKFIKEYNLAMTWSKNTAVYLYKVI